MTQRERVMAVGLLGAVVLAGIGFLFQMLILGPLHERHDSIALLDSQLAEKQARVRQITAEKPKLERWKQLSLPPDTDLARREYEKYLTDLLRKSGFAAGASVTPRNVDSKSAPTIPGKGPIYSKVPFGVQGRATLDGIVQMLEGFYQTGLLHQIKNISITRPLTPGVDSKPGELDVNLTVEALILTGTDSRTTLLPSVDRRLLAIDTFTAMRGGPGALALVPWAVGPTGPLGPGELARPVESYASIADKNIFMGPNVVASFSGPEVELTQFVFLTDITRNERRQEAFLYDRYNNRKTRLRASAGFDSFKITDGEGETVVHGKVLRMDEREVIFQTDNEKLYALHIGQSLGEALRKPLSASRAKELNLAAAAPDE